MVRTNLVLTAAFCAGFACLAPASAQAQQSQQILNGTTTIALDPTFYNDLITSGITVSAASPATFTSNQSETTLSVPIVAGGIDLSTGLGTAFHKGGITFTSSSLSLVVTVGSLALVNGGNGSPMQLYGLVSANNQVYGLYPLFNFQAGSVLPIPENGGVFNLSNVKLKLTPQTAALLNNVFQYNGFSAGMTIGTAQITGQAAEYTSSVQPKR